MLQLASILIPISCSRMSKYTSALQHVLQISHLLLQYLLQLLKSLLNFPGWCLTPSRYGRASIMRASKEIFLIGTNEIQYQILPGPTWTRLLKIEAGLHSAVLRCSLRQTDLSSEPRYTALSYTWKQDLTWAGMAYSILKDLIQDFRQGEDIRIKFPQNTGKLKRSGVIICNGSVTRIHPNLYNALVRLRQKGAGEYWIDALCINQNYVKSETGGPCMNEMLTSSVI
jgi:hypothetical protein